MGIKPQDKYLPYGTVNLTDRTWPSATISKPPAWVSVDLRDGNQSLVIPMSVEEKLDFFAILTEIGFKEIEVGFPSSSQIEYDFMRRLIGQGLVPGDVTIQVLTPSREDLIKKTFDSLEGAERAIIHLYNSTSEVQRRIVFGMSKREVIAMAQRGTEIIRAEADKRNGGRITFQYSPESFTHTEPDFALDICTAVMDVWGPTPEKKAIINLPSTVEASTPNVYADRIEWFSRRFKYRDSVLLSVHAHNDRGTAVAATELAILAGAERVEGTLFGNGERTGNVDIITLAMNMFTQGIDTGLDFSNVNRIIQVYERCTKMQVYPRHPYAGELVFTAFSGSHQDAISKGISARRHSGTTYWDVPYLPIDPADVGRAYESIIRINSQSGKGGIAYVMEQVYGLKLPKDMQPEFRAIVQSVCDCNEQELSPEALWRTFDEEYLKRDRPYSLKNCRITNGPDSCGSPSTTPSTMPSITTLAAQSTTIVTATISDCGTEREVGGAGNGPIDAFCRSLETIAGTTFKLISYHEHAMGQGSNAMAVSYIQIETDTGKRVFGAGIDTDISIASMKALLSALNRTQPENTRQ
ncbi:MAG: 2-isopropylmalate synthase [Nitrospirae bacterium]|nr:2-isopropylmalate synthase [Nitrospirota bacterium]